MTLATPVGLLPAPCTTTHAVFATFAIGRRETRLLAKVIGVSPGTVTIAEGQPAFGLRGEGEICSSRGKCDQSSAGTGHLAK